MRGAALIAPLSAALLLAGCGGGSGEQGGEGGLTVITAFYPLEYAVAQVAGDDIEVVSLTSPGVDPHALELTPRDIGRVGSADLVVYLGGMQDAVDAAVAQQAEGRALDVAAAADLVATGVHGSDGHEDGHEDGHDDDHTDGHTDDDGHDDHGDEHADEHADHEHDHGDVDPHFWLDTDRYAAVTAAIAEELAALDPDNADDYRARAATFTGELEELGQSYADGLASCERQTLVTTHAAFGYLTDKYGFEQVAMTGSSPESEPTPTRLAEIVRIVEQYQVTTIYSEILAGSEWARAVAAETGVEVQVLDPIEGITDRSPGSDYREVMAANLQTLRQGQGCS